MRDLKNVSSAVMWCSGPFRNFGGSKAAIVKLPNGSNLNVIVGTNEHGWEHVSVSKHSGKLPSWEEMCYIKGLFWDDEEEVVQFHPRLSEYVNISECLHLWRPADGDWSIINREHEQRLKYADEDTMQPGA